MNYNILYIKDILFIVTFDSIELKVHTNNPTPNN